MKKLFRFMDWPLRAKMATLLIVVSLLPLTLAAFIDVQEARRRLLANTADLLAARADQLLVEIDTFHRGYQRSVDRVAHLPIIRESCQARPEDRGALTLRVRAILGVFSASDANIRGVAILDPSGTVKVATEDRLIGLNLSYHSHVREAMQGALVISNIHLAESEVAYAPTIAYLAPVLDADRKIIGIAAIWVRGTSLWDVMKKSNSLAGPDSFAVMFDNLGIRIAHTYSEDMNFHPGGLLDPGMIDAMEAERRFGEKTRELLAEVRAFPQQFDRALSESPALDMFRGFAPVNRTWNYGVARRFETVPWTVFYMIPEASLETQIAGMTRKKTIFAGGIILLALVTGTLFAVVILKPVRSLSEATQALAGGDLAARVRQGRGDELGLLNRSFNSMAERIEAQAAALQKARDELELRVQERTAELVQTTEELEAQVTERKRAEEALRDSQARLSGIVDSAMDAIISVDGDQKIVLFNAAAEKIFRCAADTVVGQPIDTLIPRQFREAHRTDVEGFGRTGVTARAMRPLGTLRGLRADGEEFPIEASISQVEAAGQRFFTVILRDITERQTLDAERQKFVSLAENSLEFIGICDMQGTPFFINEAGLRLVGLNDLEHAIRTPVKEFFFPNDQAFIAEEFLPKVQRDGHGEVEIRFRHFTTLEPLWMLYNVFVIPDADGQPVALATVSRNITGRKRAEEELRASEAKLQTIVENLTEGLAVSDLDGNLQQFNRAALEMHGFANPEEGHRHLSALADTFELAELDGTIMPVDQWPLARILRGENVRNLEVRVRQIHAGWERIFKYGGTLVRDSNGQATLGVVTVIDITERKRAGEEISQLNTELEQRVMKRTAELEAANKELEAFSYSVSHDLRAPLRAVDGFSQAVVEDYGSLLPEDGRRYLQTIRESAQRMGELIDDLLTFSRLSRQPLNIRPVDTVKLVRNALEDMGAERDGRQIDVRIGDLPRCQGDPALLKQVWINLLSNALKFTGKREAAVVEIGSVRTQSENAFFVRDNGSGFDMKYAAKLFGVFQRLHRAEEFEGTGVGLAIVQRIIHRHGGRVWADAAEGRGATFYFTVEGETNDA